VTKLLVAAALLGVAQDVVGLADLFELPLGRLIARVDIGVVLPRQLPVGPLDLLLRGTPAQAQDVIVVPLRHPLYSREPPADRSLIPPPRR
jgi:hypothetical protein